jgi:hypothetical protein
MHTIPSDKPSVKLSARSIPKLELFPTGRL